MAGTLSPFPKLQFFTNAGAVAASYQVFTYVSGSSTKTSTYTDSDLTSANTNPIVLDSAGRCTMYLDPAVTYKVVFTSPTDTDPPVSPIWTVDPVAPTPASQVDLDVSGTAGEALTANEAVYLSDGSGGTTAGRWYKTDSDAAATATSPTSVGFVVANASSGASCSVRLSGRMDGFAGLTTGAPYYCAATAGTITSAAPAIARLVGVADSATTLLIQTLAGAPASGSVPGWVTIGAQTLAGVKTFSSPPLFTTAGAGTASIGGRLTSVYASVGNVGAGEDDLMTFSLPAGTLGTDGMSVRVLAWGTSANNANAKTLKAYFGATQLLGGSGFSLTVSQAGNWLLGFNVLRDAATTQRAAASAIVGPAGGPATASCTGVTTPAETLANAITIKLTGEATSDNDIVQTGMVVTLAC